MVASIQRHWRLDALPIRRVNTTLQEIYSRMNIIHVSSLNGTYKGRKLSHLSTMRGRRQEYNRCTLRKRIYQLRTCKTQPSCLSLPQLSFTVLFYLSSATSSATAAPLVNPYLQLCHLFYRRSHFSKGAKRGDIYYYYYY